MHFNMASAESVKSFVEKASTELDRIDGVVANAGIMIDQWSQTEGMETSITVNVTNTLVLGALFISKLSKVASKILHSPHHYLHRQRIRIHSQRAKWMKSRREGSIFDGLNNQSELIWMHGYRMNVIPS